MRHWFSALATLGVALTLTVGAAQAFTILEPNSAGNVRVEAGTTVEDTVLAGGSDVSIRGTVANDAFLAGSEVSIDNTVDGNAVVAGRSVRITGRVKGDLFAAAGTLIVEKSAIIEGDILAFAGTVDQTGSVRGNVQIYAGTTRIDGTVDGNVTVQSESLALGDNARIGGAVTGTTTKPLVRAEGATVAGTVNLQAAPASTPADPGATAAAANFLGQLYSYIVLIVLGTFLILLAPKMLTALREHAYAQPGQSLLIGLATLLVAPALFILSLVLVVTVPLAFVELAVLGIVAFLGNIVTSIWVGDLLTKKQWSPLLALALGGFVIRLVSLVPVLGAFLGFATWLVGFGTVLSDIWLLYHKHAK
ncbi:MAG: bactofilin family protein [Patescibacteria group bacterium]|jgi:cytoskeletal protein CcmA (bactofilin family)